MKKTTTNLHEVYSEDYIVALIQSLHNVNFDHL